MTVNTKDPEQVVDGLLLLAGSLSLLTEAVQYAAKKGDGKAKLEDILSYILEKKKQAQEEEIAKPVAAAPA